MKVEVAELMSVTGRTDRRIFERFWLRALCSAGWTERASDTGRWGRTTGTPSAGIGCQFATPRPQPGRTLRMGSSKDRDLYL